MSAVVLSFDVGTRNLAVCKVVVHPGDTYTVLHWDVMDVLEGVCSDSKKLGIPETAQHMIDTLQRNEILLLQDPAPTTILIEQQPGGKFVNVGMKALSHVLQTFLYMKTNNTPIHFVSPRRKLREAKSHDKDVSQKKRYSSNKQFAKDAVLELLGAKVTNSEEALTIFNSRTKKDDLADSLLQAVAFCTAPPAKKRRTTPTTTISETSETSGTTKK